MKVFACSTTDCDKACLVDDTFMCHCSEQISEETCHLKQMIYMDD